MDDAAGGQERKQDRDGNNGDYEDRYVAIIMIIADNRKRFIRNFEDAFPIFAAIFGDRDKF